MIVVVAANVYHAWLVQKLLSRVRIPVVVVSVGSPYLLRHFPKVSGYLCTFSYLPVVLKAAAKALAGRQSITGRLPITLSRNFRRGHGLTIRNGACLRATASR